MKDINWWLYVITMFLYILTIASCIVVILKENRNPIRSISWIIALIFLPVIGLVFYIFFGRSLRGQRMISRMNKQKMITNMAPKLVDLNSLNLSRPERNLVKLARNISSSFLYSILLIVINTFYIMFLFIFLICFSRVITPAIA